MKNYLIALFALLILAAAMPFTMAMSVEVKEQSTSPVSVIVGENVPIKVVYSFENVSYEDVILEAELAYRGRKVSVESRPIDVVAGTTYVNYVELKIPSNIKVTGTGEFYTLSVTLKEKNGKIIDSSEVKVTVQKENDQLDIQKVMTTNAKAGEPMKVTVVAKNTGSDTQEDVYVTVSIPELGIVAEERMGDIAAVDKGEDEDVATNDLLLNIPADAATGTYTMNIKVASDNVVAKTTKSISVNGVATGDKFIEVVPTVKMQDVEQGKSATYTLRVANLGEKSQTYSVYVEGTDGWATYQANPLVFTLSPESNQLVTVGITAANNALIGEHGFTVKIKSNDAEKSIALTAYVKDKSSGFDAMLISVIVLAVVLLVLIVLLVKSRKASEETIESTEESYY